MESSSSVRPFIPRAPRYVLRPQDRHVMRFSLENTSGPGGIEQTILINLSETGIAFLVNPGKEPRLGERIKVEIPVPSGDQIAWWARVVRTSEFEPRGWLTFGRDRFQDDHKILVALAFEPLPEGHSRAIRKGLNASFMQAMRDQQYITWLYYKAHVVEKGPRIGLYLALTLLTVLFIWWFSQPDGKYDAKRGTQWGERYLHF